MPQCDIHISEYLGVFKCMRLPLVCNKICLILRVFWKKIDLMKSHIKTASLVSSNAYNISSLRVLNKSS